MKKIAFVSTWYGETIPGGAEMELRGLVHHLHDAGVPVEILTTCVKDFSSNWAENVHPEGLTEENGIPVRRFRAGWRDSAAFDRVNWKLMNGRRITFTEEATYLAEMVNSPRLYQYIADCGDRYSLFVFIPYLFGTTYFGSAAAGKKAVLIPCLHDESYAYLQMFRERFSQVGGMAFNAPPEAELAHRLYDLSRVKTITPGIGMDTGIRGDAGSFRRKYGLEKPFILYAGRKDAGKNVDELLDYVARMKSEGLIPELQVVLIGGGSIEIPEAIAGDVHDLGFVPVQDKYDACAAAKFLCQPSRHESFSLVIMESWLCGRPVLVSGQCAVTRDFASRSNGGLWFSSYPQFSAAVQWLLSHPGEAAQMGRSGGEFVRRSFDWDTVVRSYLTFFEEVARAAEPEPGQNG